MKQNILVGITLLIMMGLGVFGFIKLTQPTKPTSGTLSQNSKLGNIHEVATDQGKVIVGNPKSSNTNKIEPQIELSKWNEEVKMKVNYDIQAKEVIADENSIIWKGDKQDLIYKQIPARKETTLKKIPKPKIKLAQNNNEIRYIRYGPTNLETLAASYELFEKTDTNQPTITSFIPNEEGYLFFGDRKAEIDLKNIETIPYPIVRVKTENAFSCPVALSNNNGLFLVMYYAPNIEMRGEEVKNEFTAAINNALKKHAIETEIQRRDDFFYYIKDLQIKPVGRIAYDKNILIFNLYTKSPYTTGLKDYMRTTFQKVRDEYLLPTGGLTELNPDITPGLVDEIIKEFADSNHQTIKSDTLSTLEKSTLDGLINIANNDDWKEKAMRSDIPHVDEDEKFDRFEFDILLHEKPANNVFTYQIETDGLDFFYQPELTEEEKNDGAYRPENVIGSYAIYKKDAKTIHANIVDAEKYKVGKVMHIYRPKITDAKNNSIWGILNIDINNKTLSVTVDQDWLNRASFPVLIDPTFGYASIGATKGSNLDDQLRGSSFTGAPGRLMSVTAYIECSKRFPIYGVYTLGSPSSSKIAQSNMANGCNNAGADTFTGWLTMNTTINPTISAVSYVLAIYASSGVKGYLYRYYDSGAGQDKAQTISSNLSVLPSTADFSTFDNKYSIYATYTKIDKTNLKGNLNLRGNIKLQ